jgi:hypothetical protein
MVMDDFSSIQCTFNFTKKKFFNKLSQNARLGYKTDVVASSVLGLFKWYASQKVVRVGIQVAVQRDARQKETGLTA